MDILHSLLEFNVSLHKKKKDKGKEKQVFFLFKEGRNILHLKNNY
jgi:hypothetical protein